MTNMDVRRLFLNYWQELERCSDWVDLGMGMPSAQMFFPALAAQQELIAGQRAWQGAYQPHAGAPHLREAFAKCEAKRTGIAYTVDNIMVVSGALRGFSLVVNCLANNKTHFIEIVPTYPVLAGQVRYVAEKLGCTIASIIPRDHRTFRVTLDEVLPHIKPSTILYLTNPNNPTGLYISKDVLDTIVTVCEEAGAYVIIDQACDIPLMQDDKKHLWSDSRAVIRLVSLSKTYLLAGFRLGYIVAHPDLIHAFTESFAFSDGNAPVVANYAVMKYLNDDQILSFISKIIHQKVELAISCIANYSSIIHIIKPEVCFYIFLKINYANSSWHLFTQLLQQGINIVPGCLFGLDEEPWIRICCARDDNMLISSLNKFKKALDSL